MKEKENIFMPFLLEVERKCGNVLVWYREDEGVNHITNAVSARHRVVEATISYIKKNNL